MIDTLERVTGRNVSRETFKRIETYIDLLKAESVRQNLIAPSTVNAVWDRHILDSAQLVSLEPRRGVSWVDIGSGAGLPGMIVAMLVEGPITLIEPRRLRSEFLRAAVQRLDLSERVRVFSEKVERSVGSFGVIAARAVAPLDGLLSMSHHLSTMETVWILPKGRNAQSELAQAKRNWHCDVRVEQSRTNPESEILVLTKVGARKKR
jgi:16S rRNA (guanine527-N7)-methyltransferase